MEQTQEKKKRGPKAKPEAFKTEYKAEFIPDAVEPKTDHADPSPRESILQQWIAESAPCSYVKFVYPIPRIIKTEPLYEFKLAGDSKYRVDKIWYGPHGLLWEFQGIIQVTDAVQHATFIENVLA
jgi:hypothetical protein